VERLSLHLSAHLGLGEEERSKQNGLLQYICNIIKEGLEEPFLYYLEKFVEPFSFEIFKSVR
jgi:hypothetical protein